MLLIHCTEMSFAMYTSGKSLIDAHDTQEGGRDGEAIRIDTDTRFSRVHTVYVQYGMSTVCETKHA